MTFAMVSSGISKTGSFPTTGLGHCLALAPIKIAPWFSRRLTTMALVGYNQGKTNHFVIFPRPSDRWLWLLGGVWLAGGVWWQVVQS